MNQKHLLLHISQINLIRNYDNTTGFETQLSSSEHAFNAMFCFVEKNVKFDDHKF